MRLLRRGRAALQKFKKGGRPDALLRAEGGDLFGKPVLFGNLFGFCAVPPAAAVSWGPASKPMSDCEVAVTSRRWPPFYAARLPPLQAPQSPRLTTEATGDRAEPALRRRYALTDLAPGGHRIYPLICADLSGWVMLLGVIMVA